MKSFRFGFVAALCLGALVYAQGLPSNLQKVTTVEGITEYRIDNGLRVLLFPDASKPTVTINVTYLVGSRHENYGETGMAHLLEHMVFKSTTTRPDIWKELKDHGANFNGTTWVDRTNYFETVTATDENLKWAIEMEADRMVNSRIAKEELDKEMTVVRNEFEAGENNPIGVLFKRMLGAAYEWHNYGKSTIGNRADIENVPVERLRAFYTKYYQPDNAMLVIAGKFEEGKALRWIAENFGKIPRPTRKLDKLYTEEPTQDGERMVTVRRAGDIQAVGAFYHLPPATHPDFAALAVLVNVLTDTPSGRLYKALVDQKKAAQVFEMTMETADAGGVLFMAQLTKEQKLDEARDVMMKVIETVAKEAPSAEEVDRAKTDLLKGIELAFNRSDRIGVELSEYAAMGDWRMFFVGRDRLKSVKPEDVKRVAEKYMKESNRTYGQFIPTAKPDRAEIPAAPPISEALKDYKGQQAVAQGEAFDPSHGNIDKRTKVVTLPNGMKLMMLAKQTRGNSVVAAATFRFGAADSLKDTDAASSAAASLLMRGTTKRSRQQIQDELNRLKARLNVGGSGAVVSASAETIRGSLAETLTLMAEVLREPSFPETEFEPVRAQALAGINQGKQEPSQVAITALRRHLQKYPKGDVREASTPEEAEADWKAVTLDQAKAFYRKFYGASNADLSIVGDFDPAEIEALVRKLFGDWKSPAKYERVTREMQSPTSVNLNFETPDKSNAFFAAGMNMPVNDEHPDYPALVLASYMFGGGAKNRLMDRLRQKEGYSYGAGAQFAAATKEPISILLAFAILNPANMAKLEAAFQEEVDKSVKEGFGKEEVESSRKAWLQEQLLGRSNDQQLARTLSANEFFGRNMAWRLQIEEKVKALTPEQVNAAWAKHISFEKMSLFKAGDFKKVAATPPAK
jgi:zinc protease